MSSAHSSAESTFDATSRSEPSGAACEPGAIGSRCLPGLTLRAIRSPCCALPSLFVGCRVGVEAAPVEAASAAELAVERQVGVLVRWDGADDSAAHVLLDSQLSELRLYDSTGAEIDIAEATNPDGWAGSPGSNENVNQLPSSLIDGLTTTKWYDGSAARQT